jgi:hypothetical protein
MEIQRERLGEQNDAKQTEEMVECSKLEGSVEQDRVV